MIAEIENKNEYLCCGNCEYLKGKMCEILKIMIINPAGVCENYEFDGLEYFERIKILRGDE